MSCLEDSVILSLQSSVFRLANCCGHWLSAVSNLVWDTFSKGFGATASEHSGRETWLGLLDQVLNQTLAHGLLGSEPAGPTFNYLAKPCIIAQEIHWRFFLIWSMFICMLSCSVMSDSLPAHGLCGLSCSSVPGILQARILEWAAIPFSRRFSLPRDQTKVSCIAGRIFTVWVTR